jgi:hypothetical protein
MKKTQYGQPFLLSGLDAEAKATALVPMPYTDNKTQDGASYTEKWLQELISAHPEIIPFTQLGEPVFSGAVSTCMELPVASNKFLDNLLVTDQGYLVLIECKLWRNPEARRTVIGQILDYATEVSRWDYESLDQAVRKAKPAPGISKDASLYARVQSAESLSEKDFVDAVSRNLKYGLFLLLIVGDGIHEGVEAIAGFLQGHAGQRFTLGMVDLALYPLPEGRFLAQPRVLMRTEVVERGVVVLKDERIEVRPFEPGSKLQSDGASLRPTKTISEGEMLNQLEAKEPGLGARLQAFIQSSQDIGVSKELTPTTIKLVGAANDNIWPLAMIDPKDGSVWFDMMAKRAGDVGRKDEALKFYRRLVEILDDLQLRQEKLAPGTKSGVRSLPLSNLLRKPEQWKSAIADYLKAMGSSLEAM